MSIVKDVSNGDPGVTFKAVALGHVIAIVFSLVSLLGAQQTWLWSATYERRIIVEKIQADIARESDSKDRAISASFVEVNRRLSILEDQIRDAQRQININTGRIERMR